MIAENPHTPDGPIGAAPSRDIATGEKVEAELDSFISRRHEQRAASEDERAVEEGMERKLADVDKLFPAPAAHDFAPAFGAA